MSTSPITVRIPYDKFWQASKRHDIHMNVSVFKTLREAGIPVDGGIEFRAVRSGRISMWNEFERGVGRVCVYEWTPPDEDDEL